MRSTPVAASPSALAPTARLYDALVSAAPALCPTAVFAVPAVRPVSDWNPAAVFSASPADACSACTPTAVVGEVSSGAAPLPTFTLVPSINSIPDASYREIDIRVARFFAL